MKRYMVAVLIVSFLVTLGVPPVIVVPQDPQPKPESKEKVAVNLSE